MGGGRGGGLVTARAGCAQLPVEVALAKKKAPAATATVNAAPEGTTESPDIEIVTPHGGDVAAAMAVVRPVPAKLYALPPTSVSVTFPSVAALLPSETAANGAFRVAKKRVAAVALVRAKCAPVMRNGGSTEA